MLADDANTAANVSSYRAPIAALNTLVVGSLATAVQGAANKAIGRNQETSVGDLVCEALLWGAQTIVSGLFGRWVVCMWLVVGGGMGWVLFPLRMHAS